MFPLIRTISQDVIQVVVLKMMRKRLAEVGVKIFEFVSYLFREFGQVPNFFTFVLFSVFQVVVETNRSVADWVIVFGA